MMMMMKKKISSLLLLLLLQWRWMSWTTATTTKIQLKWRGVNGNDCRYGHYDNFIHICKIQNKIIIRKKNSRWSNGFARMILCFVAIVAHYLFHSIIILSYGSRSSSSSSFSSSYNDYNWHLAKKIKKKKLQ